MDSGKGVLVFAAFFLLTACSSLRINPAAAPSFDRPPTVDMSLYKSPNLRPGPQDPNLSIALSFSGGGARAAGLATGVLLGLEEIHDGRSRNNNLLGQVDYLSTVSGGGFAAALYLETVKRAAAIADGAAPFSYKEALEKLRTCKNGKKTRDTLHRHLERGYHDNIIRGAIRPAVVFSSFDRGDALEKEIDQKLLGGECSDGLVTLGDFFVAKESEENPTLPVWISNATIFQNGYIFPFAPNVLRDYSVVGYSHAMENIAVERTPQTTAEIPDEYFGFPAAVGVKASAAFPVVIPATTLQSSSCNEEDSGCYVHLMDGGLSDNLGIVSALRAVAHERMSRKRILLVVDAFPGELAAYSRNEGSPTIPQVLARVTELNKDAWRQLIVHGDVLEGVSLGDVTVIFITIDNLEVLRGIGTNLNAGKGDYQALIECGKYLALSNAKEILHEAELGWGEVSRERVAESEEDCKSALSLAN